MSTDEVSAGPVTPPASPVVPSPDPAAATAVTETGPGPGPAASGQAPAAPPARREHRFDIDLLRVICACAVITGHVGGECMLAVGKSAENGRAVYWTGLFLDSVTSWAVPMYFAIAGWAVLVGAPPRNGGTLRKRSLRMIIPVGIWSAVYLLWGRLRDTNGGPTSKLALDALFGTVQPAFHLWYFYAHVPLILILGFVMLLKAGKRPWGVVAALVVISAGPTAFSDLARLTGWDVPHFGWQVGSYSLVYAVIGALLLSLPATRRRHRGWWLAGAVASMGPVLWSQDRIHFVIPNASIFVAALSVCVLFAANGVRIPERMRPALTKLTDAGLGAFMFHVLLLKTIAPAFLSADRGWLGAAGAAAALTVVTVVPSFGLSMLWGRFKLRRYLG
ncbi:acyltransferase [Streptomyces sp. WMMB303]|uniref:acyltransferase n=1 Tax=Streptomyces sp. WMMB303 TaxID=3034154 RepID=UPI0023EDB282|nr:acyltransferase [Streptomyces sp. WMMB303]MDF4249319.1 acyltransferase [Streptomyces sp. WMMB303]